MPYSRAPKKPVGPNDFVFVKSVYGKGPNAKANFEHIVDGGMNDVIKRWQYMQPEHPRDHATPSTLLTCPRVVWLLNKGVEPENEMTWAVKQRLLLGRLFENQFAVQLKDLGMLLHHWKDDPGVVVDKFAMGEGLDFIDGVPDYLLDLNSVVTVSDAKTSRSDSFGYIGTSDEDIWKDWGWYKYRIQVTAYFMLCAANYEKLQALGLPFPSQCHLFSYALDDGVVRREITWKPTQEDIDTVRRLTRRYNEAVASPTMPECTCNESFEQFDVKFCKFAIKPEGSKVGTSCCDDSLESRVKI